MNGLWGEFGEAIEKLKASTKTVHEERIACSRTESSIDMLPVQLQPYRRNVVRKRNLPLSIPFALDANQAQVMVKIKDADLGKLANANARQCQHLK